VGKPSVRISRLRQRSAQASIAQPPDPAQVLEGNGLPAPRVVRDRHHHQRDAVALLLEGALEGPEVHVALEGVDLRGNASLGDHEVAGLRPLHLDVGPGRVEVVVVGHDLTGLEDGVEEDPLRGPPLMGGDDVSQARELAHHVPEAVVGAASRVGLVALHERAPLRGRHGPGSGVGEEIDEDVLGVQAEDVVPRLPEGRLAFLAGGELHRLHRLDAEGLDDRLEVRHETPRV
jgi:hypothetical protein